MESVIKTYIICTKQFEDEVVFNNALEGVSPYRRQKIALLKHIKDKNRSLGAAVALNEALKDYGLEERTMEYDLGEHGKPYFRYNPELRFSLSHSGDYAICSIGAYEVGNDIERIKSGKESIAQRFYAKEELDWINAAQDLREKEERIFRIWTMKESFLKVTGNGMSLPLNSFAIIAAAPPASDGRAADLELMTIRQNINNISYNIKEYVMPEGFSEENAYKIAVCSEGRGFAPKLIVI